MVQVMRRRNIRNIDLGIRQQFLGRLIHMPYPKLFSIRFGMAEICGTYRINLPVYRF